MRVSLAHILVLTASATIASTAQTGRLSREENQKRLEECGIQKMPKVLDGNTTTAPFLVLVNRNPGTSLSGVLISKRHVIAHRNAFLDLDLSGFNGSMLDMCKKEVPKNLLRRVDVTKCGTKSVCKSSNSSQTPSRALYIGSCNKTYSEQGIVVLEFEKDFKDKPVVPICLNEKQFKYGDKLKLYGLGAPEPNEGSDFTIRSTTIKGDNCGIKWSVCTDPISCSGDSGAPFVINKDGRQRVVAIASSEDCLVVDTRGVNHLLLHEVANFICDFSGVCSKKKKGSTTTMSKKPTTVTTTRRTTRMPTTKPITTAATTSTPTTTTATTTLPPTIKVITTVTPSPLTSSEPTTVSMSTLADSTSSTMGVEADTTSSSVSPTSTTAASPVLSAQTKQKQTKEPLTPPVVVIDKEDETGLEVGEEEKIENVYIDEPDVSSRDTSVLLVFIFSSFIFLLH